MGLCWCYRKFVPNFGLLAVPLADLMTTKRRFCQADEDFKAFETLKYPLSKAPVLCKTGFSNRFSIHCVASKTGIGAVLMQGSKEGGERPIALISLRKNALRQ